MPPQAAANLNDSVCFGRFRLNFVERVLERDNVRVPLGSRAFDILVTLVKRAGQVVSTAELLETVWPDLTVDANNVRVQIVALRKALGEEKGESDYIANVPGHGYSFVAKLTDLSSTQTYVAAVVPEMHSASRLPARSRRMIGRDADVAEVSTLLRRTRFVSVVGTGGIGKTTLAVAVAHELFDLGEIRFLDFSQFDAPGVARSALFSALDLVETAEDPIPVLLANIRTRRLLLVLDNCENVLEVIACLSERLILGAPNLYILATSREAIRVQGENVYPLEALPFPPQSTPSASEAILYPAVQLFVERAAANLGQFELTDSYAPVVSRICRRLDGLALAIELASSQLAAFGIAGVAGQLDDQWQLNWSGRRTAPTRHQTLRATIDWSYRLLTEREQTVLRSLSVIVGQFTLETAQAVASTTSFDEAIELIDSFVSKSLLSVVIKGEKVYYRLLDTTREYLLDRMVDYQERNSVAERHARFFCDVAASFDAQNLEKPRTDGAAQYGDVIGNLHKALHWSFSADPHYSFGITLASHAAPLFLEQSLYQECLRWTELALSMLGSDTKRSAAEVELRLCYGWAQITVNGNSDSARRAFIAALEISEELGLLYQNFRILGLLHLLAQRMGEINGALALAARAEWAAQKINHPAAATLSSWLLGLSHHFAGHQLKASSYCASAQVSSDLTRAVSRVHFGFDHRIRAGCILARSLWLEGYLDRARGIAAHMIEEASKAHTTSICFSLVWATPLFIEYGERSLPETLLERLTEVATAHSMKPYAACALGWKGVLKIKHGDLHEGTAALEEAIARLKSGRYDVLNQRFARALADAYWKLGRGERAYQIIDAAIAQALDSDDPFHLPELFRLKGEVLASTPALAPASARECFEQARAAAREQSALIWELRAQVGLARLRDDRFELEMKRLFDVYGSFSEGFESLDLKAAKELITLPSRDATPPASFQKCGRKPE